MEIIYDRTVKRFRYPEGTFASAAVVEYQSKRFLNERQDYLVSLAPRLAANPTDVKLQKEVAETLRDIHVTAATIAAGGPQYMYANDYLIVARGLKNQYGLTDNNPKEYGLKFLYQDISTGYTGESRLVERLRMYSQSSKTAYYSVEVNKRIIDGSTQARRVLGFAEHCRECKDYSTYGWIGINDIIIPTQKCSCYTNCKCTLEYR